MTISNATAARNAQADALATQAAGGKLRVYSGTPPANANTGLSGNTMLVELALPNPAFGAASNGTITANTIAAATIAAGGTAAFYRALKSDNTVLWQGSVSLTGAGGDLQVDGSTTLVAGVQFQVTNFSYTVN